jgi:carboxyl-terminal processing protease
MRKTVLAAAAAGWMVAAAAARAEDAAGKLPSPEDRALIAAQLHTMVSLYFAHGEAVPELDLDQATGAYLAEALAATDRRAFDLATMAFLARLRNGHTSFHDAELGAPWDRNAGFRARPLGRDWVVTWSRLPSIRVGDVVKAIDGEPMEAFYGRARRYLAASSDRAARNVLFFRNIVFPVKYVVTLGDGKRVEIDRAAPIPAGKNAPVVEGRWIDPGRVAYLRVSDFGDAAYEEAAIKRLEELRGAQALIVDVRGNGGGNTPIQLIAKLMDRPWRWWSQTTPLAIARARALAQYGRLHQLPEPAATYFGVHAHYAEAQLYWPGEVTPAEPGAYTGKVIVLVDADCGSSCEDFALPFKDTRRGTIVGETTGGSTGSPFTMRFPGGMEARVGTVRVRMPDGSPFEGVGIAPDVAIEPTPADLRAGRDSVLDAAIRLARGGT